MVLKKSLAKLPFVCGGQAGTRVSLADHAAMGVVRTA